MRLDWRSFEKLCSVMLCSVLFVYLYQVVEESNWTHRYILPEDSSPNLLSGYTATHTLTDLRPNMRYQLEILARNKFGWSNSSETPFEFTTAKGN